MTPRRERSPWLRRASWAILSILIGAGVCASAWWVFVVRPGEARALAQAQSRDLVDRAGAAIRRGEPALALSLADRVPDDGPWKAEILTIRGLALAALDRPEDARPFLERSLELEPRQVMATKVLAAVYFSDEELDRGFRLLERAAQLDPTDFRPWYATGDVLLHYRNLPDKAVPVFEGALKLQPDDVETRLGLAEALLALGKANEASPLLDRLLQERPDDFKVWRLAATRAALLSRSDDVERYAGQVLDLRPDDQNMLTLRANSRLRDGRPQEALPDAERAAAHALPHQRVAALAVLARVEGALGLKERAEATSARHRQALALAERLENGRSEVRQKPNDPAARLRLAEAAAAAGIDGLALRNYREALALDPNLSAAREGLAALEAANHLERP